MSLKTYKKASGNYNWIFMIVAFVIVIAASIPIIDSFQTKNRKDAINVRLSMSGFSPNVIEGNVGEPIKLYLINMDNQYHADGGGWHQLASDELNFDFNIPPKGEKLVSITADKPGEYLFYCDVCCGGKENPDMQGTIIIT